MIIEIVKKLQERERKVTTIETIKKPCKRKKEFTIIETIEKEKVCSRQ